MVQHGQPPVPRILNKGQTDYDELATSASMRWAKTGMLQNGAFDEKMMIIKLENDDEPLDFRFVPHLANRILHLLKPLLLGG